MEVLGRYINVKEEVPGNIRYLLTSKRRKRKESAGMTANPLPRTDSTVEVETSSEIWGKFCRTDAITFGL